MRRFFCAVFLALAVAIPTHAANVWGIDIPGLELQFGYDFILNAIDESAQSPLVDNSFGASIPFGIVADLMFRPEVSVFFQEYQWDKDTGNVFPVETMFDNVTIMSLLLNANLDYEFHLGKTLTLSTGAGMAFQFRFPLAANGSKAGDMVLPLTGWFIAGRFLYPDLGLGLLYQYSDKYTLFVRTQTLYPMYNLWDTSAPTWWHEMTFNLLLGVRFNL